MRVHTNLAVPLRRGWCLQKFDIWSQSLGEITWIYSMSYECVPIPSLIRTLGLQWLASLCIACWWSQQHSMVHRQQIKSPPWNPCCKCNPCSQLARKVPGICSVGRCTFLTLLVPLHFAFDYGFLQTRQFESRKGMKRRISVNQNELALPDQSVSTKSAWPSLRDSAWYSINIHPRIAFVCKFMSTGLDINEDLISLGLNLCIDVACGFGRHQLTCELQQPLRPSPANSWICTAAWYPDRSW